MGHGKKEGGLPLLTDAKVIKQKKIAPGYYRLTMAAPEVAEAAGPGQFLHVRCGNTLDPLLRRPISINAVDREKGEVTLLYRVAGRGTALLAEKKKGDTVSLLGPLGRGFSMPGSRERVSVVAGGLGIAPLYFLLQELGRLDHCAAVFLGAATRKQLFLIKEIKELGHKIVLATDDGSVGFPGTVTGLFELCIQDPSGGDVPVNCGGDAALALEKFKMDCLFLTSRVYGCGPRGMLKRLCEIIKLRGIPGEVSLEERMGCGVGACLSCACKTRSGRDGAVYRRACVDGPVFSAREVAWE